MPLTVPNKADAPADAQQAKLFQSDIDAIVAGANGSGVIWGCAVTAQATPDATVAVAAGAVMVNGVQASVAAGTVSLPAADTTHPRWVLISASSAGALAATAGTAAAAPLLPAIPANSVALAAVWWPANDTTAASTQITDKRALTPPAWNFTPHDHNLLAWAYDIASISASVGLSSGVIFLTRLRLPYAIPATNIVLDLATAGSGLTAGSNVAGLYDTAGNRLAQTADQSTAWASSGTKTMALTSSVGLAAGHVYVALLSVGTTPISVRRCVTNSALASLGLSGAQLRWGTLLTGQTSLPATLTLSSMSATSTTTWVGIS